MLDTISNKIYNQKFDFDLFVPSAQAVIRLAEYEAIKMNAPEIYPEHLFIGSLRLEDVEVTQVLKYIGFDRQKFQEQATKIFGNLDYEDAERTLNLSYESLACFESAI